MVVINDNQKSIEIRQYFLNQFVHYIMLKILKKLFVIYFIMFLWNSFKTEFM